MMKTLCITGALDETLEQLLATFRAAGVQAPCAVQREGAAVDITSWHRQVLGTRSAAGEPLTAPERARELSAADLFVANRDRTPWGWASSASVWLLDFWAGFDAAVGFVLVTCSPEQMLCLAMRSTETIDVEAVIADWTARHRLLLHFQQRHRDRCILVDVADAAADPQGLVRACAERFGMALVPAQASARLVLDIDALALHLAQQLALDHPAAEDLHQELAASTLPLGGAPADAAVGPLDAMRSYRDLLAGARQVGALEASARQQADRLKAVSRERDAARGEVDALREKFESTRAALQAERDIPRIAPEDLQAALARQQSLQAEQALLQMQLHHVQEELEQYYLKSIQLEQEVERAGLRWLSFLARHPEHFEWQSIGVTGVDKVHSGAVAWRIGGLDAVGRHVGDLQLDTLVNRRLGALVFKRKPGSPTPFRRWPARGPGAAQITIDALADSPAQRDLLADFGPDDWALIEALVRHLALRLEQPEGLGEIDASLAAATCASLEALGRRLADLPPVLRYESAAVNSQARPGSAASLHLVLEGVAWAGRRWPRLDVHLVCPHHRPGVLGDRVLLELPADAVTTLRGSQPGEDAPAGLTLKFTLRGQPDLARLPALGDREPAELFVPGADGPRGILGVSPVLQAIIDERPDLQATFDLRTDNGLLCAVAWLFTHGVREYELAELVDPATIEALDAPAPLPSSAADPFGPTWLMYLVWVSSVDLQASFDLRQAKDAEAYVRWFLLQGVPSLQLGALIAPRWREWLSRPISMKAHPTLLAPRAAFLLRLHSAELQSTFDTRTAEGIAALAAWAERAWQDEPALRWIAASARAEGLDAAAWQALSPERRALLAELLQRLAGVLAALEAGGAVTTRPWADWHRIVRGLRDAVDRVPA